MFICSRTVSVSCVGSSGVQELLSEMKECMLVPTDIRQRIQAYSSASVTVIPAHLRSEL